MKAYWVWDKYAGDATGGAYLVFAEDRPKALAAAMHTPVGDGGWNCLRTERAPALDRFAPGPVTDRQFHEHGYDVVCAGCERLILARHDPALDERLEHYDPGYAETQALLGGFTPTDRALCQRCFEG